MRERAIQSKRASWNAGSIEWALRNTCCFCVKGGKQEHADQVQIKEWMLGTVSGKSDRVQTTYAEAGTMGERIRQ